MREAESVTVPFEIALMFLDHLSATEAEEALQQRLLHIEQTLTDLEAVPAHGEGRGVDLAFAHRKALLKAERTWLDEMIVLEYERNENVR